MTKRLAAVLVGCTLAIAPLVALAGDANLDPTFGSFGVVTTNLQFNNDVGIGVALQTDGKIVAVGLEHDTNNPAFEQIGLVRYLPNGNLDPLFGTGGKVTTAIGTFAQGEGVAVRPDGRIVAVATVDVGGDLSFGILRYLSSGALDATFGTGGVTLTTFPGADAFATDVALDTAGGAFVCGSVSNGVSTFLVVAHYDQFGLLDPAFGTGGITTISLAGPAVGNTLARQSDGKIVVGGTLYTGPSFTNGAAPLVRLQANGRADGAFGAGTGAVTVDAGGGLDEFEDVITQGDGKIVAVGSTSPSPGSADGAILLARVKPSGSADGAFGVGGITKTNITPLGDGGAAVVQITSGSGFGQYAVAASVNGSLSGGGRFALLRYAANGQLVTGFGTGGHTEVNVGSSNDFSFDLARQPDGKMIIVGGAQQVGSVTGAFAVLRFGGNCGDGFAGPGEQCDDGNAQNGDCCWLGCQAEARGQPCTESFPSLCTADQCDGAGRCGLAAPAAGCKASIVPRKSSFQVKDKSND